MRYGLDEGNGRSLVFDLNKTRLFKTLLIRRMKCKIQFIFSGKYHTVTAIIINKRLQMCKSSANFTAVESDKAFGILSLYEG